MHAYLIITNDKALALKKAKELARDAIKIEYTIEKIADTKALIKETNISYAPTYYFINNFEKASVEAQNAFLKRLEEPQVNIKFFLVSKNEELVLPTIVSRCQLIRIADRIEPRENSEIRKFIEHPTQRLQIASKYTKREDTEEFLDNLIKTIYQKLPEENQQMQNIKLASEVILRIRGNANPTIQMAYLATAFA